MRVRAGKADYLCFMDTGVLLIVFNRPEETRQVLEVLRKAKPARLYVACDGPRENHPTDAARVAAVKALIRECVDWNPQLHTRYAEQNQGCALGVSSAISWFFEQEAQGIILEDDIIASESFFPFCAELLERYADTPEVMGITGYNRDDSSSRSSDSYFFSHYPGIWGWATWRDRWEKFRPDNSYLSDFLGRNGLEEVSRDPRVQQYLLRCFDAMQSNDSWGYAWRLAVFQHKGRIAVPATNLISNIGFGSAEATHTTGSDQYIELQERGEIGFPLHHPGSLRIDTGADDQMIRKQLGGLHDRSFMQRIKNKLASFLS